MSVEKWNWKDLIEKNDVKGCKVMLEHDEKMINQEFQVYYATKTRPFIYAAQKDRIEIVKLLLDKGVDINIKDDHGRTALHNVIYGGFTEIVKLLLIPRINKAKIDISLKDDYGMIPLHLAVKYNKLEIVKLLLAYIDENYNIDIIINETNIDGYTALHYASDLAHMEIVQLLLSNYADPNIQNKTGLGPLGCTNDDDIAELLIKKGASIEGFMRDFKFVDEYVISNELIATRFEHVINRIGKKSVSRPVQQPKTIANKQQPATDSSGTHVKFVELTRKLSEYESKIADLVVQRDINSNQVLLLRNELGETRSQKEEKITKLEKRISDLSIESQQKEIKIGELQKRLSDLTAPASHESAKNVALTATPVTDEAKSKRVQDFIQIYSKNSKEPSISICANHVKQYSGDCGHLFCLKCITELKNNGGKCTQCKQFFGQVRKIYDRKIYE
eukprot:NODE_39_length_29903_cov_0.529057.p5 type:complete len:447 gc:universal NODE_39_length_29903_cov_0.529057:23333-24673(+)